MRGCALPLTKLTPPSPSHFGNNGINSFPFPILPTQPPLFPSHSLTIHTPNPNTHFSSSTSTSFSSYHHQQQQLQQPDDEDDEESFQVLTSLRSDYNDIMIVDTPKSRMLLLDSSHNVHSILYKDKKWTDSYWDEFASLPAIVPKGPIAILGLGGGTAAHLMLDLWPSLHLEGWEIDDILIAVGYILLHRTSLPKVVSKPRHSHGILLNPYHTHLIHPHSYWQVIRIYGLGLLKTEDLVWKLRNHLLTWWLGELIDKARDYFGLSDLEKTTEDGGILNVHIGDVFIPSEDLHRRYAGIVVDLFSDGKVLPQLEEVSTWLELNERLMANGRFMVNCGGIDGGSSIMDGCTDPQISSSDDTWLLNPAMKALSKVFPGQLSWKRMSKETGANFMALTGPLPDLNSWSASVPSPLSTSVKDWRPCELVSRI